MISAKQFYGQTKIQHNAGEKSDTILEGNSPLLYSQNPSANYPIDYGYTSSMQEYYLKMKDFKLQLVWGIILLSICAVVMAVLIGFDNFKPIRRLIMVIDTPEQWNDPKKLRLTDSNEIQYLATKIMSLISGNQALEGELKSQLKLLTHTKILMMQMQINPHFLFNTFNALGMMAAEDCGIDHVLTRSIVKMANILRYALEAGELMPMHQEITHAREFIDIMELRYGEMFLVEWNISDQSENLLIPKFSLQPILENAIYHGISPNKREKGKISIQVSCDETKLKIQVEDTGVGMTEAQVTALLEHAPALEETVVRTELKQFSWSLDGAPAQTVTVPHYGAKTGRHRAVYETVFSLPPFDPQKNRVMLVFRGVDYLAEVFLNSEFVGRHEGFFAPFELDVTECVRQNSNQLRVVVKNDFTMTGNSCAEGLSADGDKIYAATGPGWDDPEEGWHHCPAGMGIYQKVFVELRPNETVTDLFVRDGRELWIECMGTDIQGKSVIFDVSLYGQNFKETVFEHLRQEPMTRIEAGVGDTLTEAQLIAEGKLHQGTPLLLGSGYNRFCLPLNIPNLRIWSPEEPNLYQVQVRLLIDGRVVSTKARQFGVRTFTQDMKSDPKGIFLLNGKKLRLRGANTMGFEQQCVMNGQFDRLLNDLLLAKLCNMSRRTLSLRRDNGACREHRQILSGARQSRIRPDGRRSGQ